jgi:hypothetical protein
LAGRISPRAPVPPPVSSLTTLIGIITNCRC